MTGRALVTLTAALLLGIGGARAADLPGQKFNISVNDLPKPYATPGVGNESYVIARPQGVVPKAPPGFRVDIYAAGVIVASVFGSPPPGLRFTPVLRTSTSGG